MNAMGTIFTDLAREPLLRAFYPPSGHNEDQE